jgi:hypothetical protein
MDVQFSAKGLDDEQKDIVNSYTERFSKACDAKGLHINIKQHKKAGGRFSYTTQVRAELKKGIKTAEATDWDFHMSVKEAFGKLQKEVKSKNGSFLSRIFSRQRRG